MHFAPVLATRRDGGRHSRAELDALAQAAARGEWPDYVLSAWLVAAYLNPLSEEETADLTLAMAESGERLDLTGLPEPWVDKHSTGGVGDKTTLVLLPLLAACGLTLVKMSGRGLGVTGGTVDKLASVPGFRTDLSPAELKRQAGEIGLALTGQTPDLAPADKALYHLRDVTGTVASVPLIVSSILSKKIAGGARTIVLDVKCGTGAFMADLPQAQALRESLERVGKRAGLAVQALVTDMDQPLGAAVGNRLEVAEARDVLLNRVQTPNTDRFRELCLGLARETLSAVGRSPDAAEPALASGAAAEKARRWFAAQGADFDGPLDVAPAVPLRAQTDGWIEAIHARQVGEIALDLGAGRRRKEDDIDPRVGLVLPAPVGTQVRAGEVLAYVMADERAQESALARLACAIRLGSAPVPPRPWRLG